jgi:transposase
VSSLLAQLQERARRRALDDRIGAFLRARYEFTKDPTHRLRRQDVYREVAKETGETDNNELRCRVADLAEKLGARGILPHRVAMFCRMRPKDAALMPAPGLTGPAALARLQRAYYARLAAEGMGDEDGEPKQLKRFHEHRREISTEFIGRAVDHYWAMRKEVEALGLYALEGLSVAEVAERTGTTRVYVQEVIGRMKTATAEPSARDRRAWELYRGGKSTREVARLLNYSHQTIANVVARMEARDRAVKSKPPGYETGDEG